MWIKIKGYAERICKRAGVEFVGYQPIKQRADKKSIPLVLFNDPKTKTTLSVRADKLSEENIQEKLKESRK